MHLDTLLSIHKAIAAIKQSETAWNLDAALVSAEASLEKFPNSTEIHLARLHLQLLSEKSIDSFETVLRAYETILSCRWWCDLGVISDIVGLKHNVLCEKWDGIESWLKAWDFVLRGQISEFLSIYFDYLSENGDGREVAKIKQEYVDLLSGIPDSYLD